MIEESKITEAARKRYNRILAWLMNLANPVVVGIMGPNINRRTFENVANSRLKVEKVTDLTAGIFKLIEARA